MAKGRSETYNVRIDFLEIRLADELFDHLASGKQIRRRLGIIRHACGLRGVVLLVFRSTFLEVISGRGFVVVYGRWKHTGALVVNQESAIETFQRDFFILRIHQSQRTTNPAVIYSSGTDAVGCESRRESIATLSSR